MHARLTISYCLYLCKGNIFLYLKMVNIHTVYFKFLNVGFLGCRLEFLIKIISLLLHILLYTQAFISEAGFNIYDVSDCFVVTHKLDTIFSFK